MKNAVKVTAPSKDDLSFRAYTTAKQLRQLRESAVQLYQSEKLSQVIQKVEREVDIKKFSIRKDRAIHADLGKKLLLKLLYILCVKSPFNRYLNNPKAEIFRKF